MNKKMAYIMHVDWNWIKQRPHFLAEHLTDYYDLDIFYIKNYAIKGLIKNQAKVNIYKLNKIPLSGKIPFLRKIEKSINKKVLNKVYSSDYDYIWISSPIILGFIDLERLQNKKIVYDCMDNLLEFYKEGIIRQYLHEAEKKLLGKAKVIFTSSEQLKKVIVNKGVNKEAIVLNNGIEPESLLKLSIVNIVNKKRNLFNIVYFGTISKWFNFNLLLELLEIHKDIMFTLIGPTDILVPKNERIRYIGAVEHSKLQEYALEADAFIMPFILNDLILSVDPVKVYEYIAFMKPTFVIRYNETEKFKDFVYLFDALEDLSRMINTVKKEAKYISNEVEVKKFIEKNSWSQRTKEVKCILDRI